MWACVLEYLMVFQCYGKGYFGGGGKSVPMWQWWRLFQVGNTVTNHTIRTACGQTYPYSRSTEATLRKVIGHMI